MEKIISLYQSHAPRCHSHPENRVIVAVHHVGQSSGPSTGFAPHGAADFLGRNIDKHIGNAAFAR